MTLHHLEFHRLHRISWLRAAVLGANDGIISISSLLIGVIAAGVTFNNIFIAGIAGLIAGAMSMAAGEYISVSSQADAEKAALCREQQELEMNLPGEIEELTTIYVKRGLTREIAEKVAKQLMEIDPLAAHARDELGITEIFSAKPLQAAFFSGCSFTLGAILPLCFIFILPHAYLISSLAILAILLLAFLGGLAAKAGESSIVTGTMRVVLWGTLAMIVSAGIGLILGIAV